MASDMQVVVCEAPHRIATRSRPLPVPAPGEVTLRIRRVGLCGTDYHIWAGQQPFLDYPRIMGHELSAEVVQAPPGSGLSPGQLVVINPYLACGTCPPCRAGTPNCCQRLAVLGVHRDGGMAEFLCLPPGNLIAADGLDPDQAASVEFLAIGAHAVRRGAVAPGARVLVIGAGPIGIGAALFARLAGGQVSLMDRDPDRLAMVAAATGITDLIPADEDLPARIAAATDGHGFDRVFDATGSAASMENSFHHVAHGGTLIFVGLVKGPLSFSDPDFHRREMSLLASRNATTADFAQVMAAIRDGAVNVAPLITHRTTMDGVVADLPRWAADKTGLIKAMVGLDA